MIARAVGALSVVAFLAVPNVDPGCAPQYGGHTEKQYIGCYLRGGHWAGAPGTVPAPGVYSSCAGVTGSRQACIDTLALDNRFTVAQREEACRAQPWYWGEMGYL